VLQADFFQRCQLVHASRDQDACPKSCATRHHHGRQQSRLVKSPLSKRRADAKQTPYHQVARDEHGSGGERRPLPGRLAGQGGINKRHGSCGRDHHTDHHDSPHESHEHEVR
jgi:hypothetical protein